MVAVSKEEFIVGTPVEGCCCRDRGCAEDATVGMPPEARTVGGPWLCVAGGVDCCGERDEDATFGIPSLVRIGGGP